MKTLLKVNYKIWVAIFLVIISSITALVLIMNIKIEKTFTTQVVVDNKNISTLIIKDKGAYLIKPSNTITLMVNSKFITTEIKDIKYDGERKEYLIKLKQRQNLLLPNTTITAKIIYDSYTVWDSLLNPGV